ncbi:MAG TPA: hypothetical protein PKE21_05425 [Flavobacteriales bacterium]|nr:hypothetical protein [Flavobacteriales bacterium]HMR26901.1 hypothetical protein [Flavobacteriales bacterium]
MSVKILITEELSEEAKAMNKAFKTATRQAARKAFTKRKTILVEEDGWLVRVRADGRVWRRVKQLQPVRLP